MLQEKLEKIIAPLEGKIALYFENLESGEALHLTKNQAEEGLNAASVIKLPILLTILKKIEAGEIDEREILTIEETDKVPSCGVVSYMEGPVKMSITDLMTMMIIHSDNTATNALIERVGMDGVNTLLRELDCSITTLERKIFDSEGAERGLKNTISIQEMGRVLATIYRGECISQNVSERALAILLLQRMNFKMPYYIPKGTPIAHKTGEDDGVTHDVGIILEPTPFVFAFGSESTIVTETEVALRNCAKGCYDYVNEGQSFIY